MCTPYSFIMNPSIPMDGRCFYHSVIAALPHTLVRDTRLPVPRDAQHLQVGAMQETSRFLFTKDKEFYVKNRMNQYLPNSVLKAKPSVAKYKTIYDTWIVQAARGNGDLPKQQWAHQVEVQATADLLHCEIYVYTNDFKPPSLTRPQNGSQNYNRTPIVLHLDTTTDDTGHYTPDIFRCMMLTFLQSVAPMPRSKNNKPSSHIRKQVVSRLTNNNDLKRSEWIPPGEIDPDFCDTVAQVLQRTVIITGMEYPNPAIHTYEGSTEPPVIVSLVDNSRFEPAHPDAVHHVQNAIQAQYLRNTLNRNNTRSREGSITFNTNAKHQAPSISDDAQSRIDNLAREAVSNTPSGYQPGTPQHNRYMDIKLHQALQSLSNEAHDNGPSGIERLQRAAERIPSLSNKIGSSSSSSSSSPGFVTMAGALIGSTIVSIFMLR